MKNFIKKALSSGALANLFCVLIIAASLILFCFGMGTAAVITLGVGIALFGAYMLAGALVVFPYLYRMTDTDDKTHPAFILRRAILLVFSVFLIIAGISAALYGILTA